MSYFDAVHCFSKVECICNAVRVNKVLSRVSSFSPSDLQDSLDESSKYVAE